MPELKLYYFTGCPYCAKVRSYLDDRNISIPMINTRETSENREELIAIAGRGQVPCLVIDGDPLHESEDIIRWFKDNWK